MIDPALFSERNSLLVRQARSAKCDLALRYFSIQGATGNNEAQWAPFQVQMLNETGMLAVTNKARQIGFSFMSACDALADVLLKQRYTVVTVSFNLEEAKEKVRYANQWWESRIADPSGIPVRQEYDDAGIWQGVSPHRLPHWPELTVNNSLEVQFDNGSRFMSLPCKPPRGKQASVILDEFAHALGASGIYTAAFWMITRGASSGLNWIRIGSTPMGAGGRFWEIFTNQGGRYKDFHRYEFGWWQHFDLCTDIIAAEQYYQANKPHSDATLSYMMARWGTTTAKMLWENNLLEDCMQEFCMQFQDESEAFLSWELIQSCYPENYHAIGNAWDLESMTAKDVEDEWENAYLCRSVRGAENCMTAISDIADWVRADKITGPLVWGYDVGRTRDVSQIAVFEVRQGHLYQRAILCMPTTEFEMQMAVCVHVVEDLPIVRGVIDRGGIGMQLAEKLERTYGERAMGVTYDESLKDLWASQMKIAMQHGQITLIPDTRQEKELHDAKRVVTGSSRFRYELTDDSTTAAGQKVSHHLDLFWADATGIFVGLKTIGGGTSGPSTGGEQRKTDKAREQVQSKGFKRTTMKAREATEHIRGKMGWKG